MKIIVLAQDISVQHWLGRLLNEAGMTPAQDHNCQIQNVHSLDEALAAAKGMEDHCMTLVRSAAVSGLELARIPDFPGHLVLINNSGNKDRFFLDHSHGTHVFEKDLDADRLRELLSELVHV